MNRELIMNISILFWTKITNLILIKHSQGIESRTRNKTIALKCQHSLQGDREKEIHKLVN